MLARLLDDGQVWLYPKTEKEFEEAYKWYKKFSSKFNELDDVPAWVVPIEDQGEGEGDL
jgi:hypothetical protein